MTAHADFPTVFARLKQILEPYAAALVTIADAPDNYVLDAPLLNEAQKEVMFGAIKIHKSYVSYYLMGVYFFPELRDGISEKMAKRLPGNACFNFKAIDETLMAELSALTALSFERFKAAGWVPQDAVPSAVP